MSSQDKMKGQCSNCGWVTRRKFKNMERKPCPKCGGHVVFHEDDIETARTIAILSIVGMAVIGILFVSLGIAEW